MTSRQAELDLRPWGTNLSAQIHGLRRTEARRLLLTHFFAGDSWASCRTKPLLRDGLVDGGSAHTRRLAQTSLLHSSDRLRALSAKAIANADKYLIVGLQHMFPAALRLLQSLLGWTAIGQKLPHANALSACTAQKNLPPDDVATASQLKEVRELLQVDVELHYILEQRFLHQYFMQFGTTPRPM